MTRGFVSLSILLLCIWPSVGEAHSGSASYFRVSELGDGVSLTVSLDLRDLEYAVGLDADRNGEITWGELQGRSAALREYVAQRVQMTREERPCALLLNDLAVDEIAGNIYAVMAGSVDCEGRDAIALKSDLLFDLDSAHRALVEWERSDRKTLAVLTRDQRETREPVEAGIISQLNSFGLEGMLHIWSGFDHLAFLLVLLLPTFVSSGGSGVAWRRLVAIITAFTVAHSITLALAIGGVMSPPERPVEIAIAVSVIVAALTNLLPRAHAVGVTTAFAFGLLHGFGFASALQGLSVDTGSFATALAGFNLGVEAGQLIVVAASLPFVLWLRRRPVYAKRFVPIASCCVAVLGSFWVFERVTS